MTQSVQAHNESQVADRYEALFRLSNALSAHRNPQALFDALTDELLRVIQFDGLAVARYDEASNTAEWYLSRGCSEHEECVPPEPSTEQSIPQWIHDHQKPLVIPHVGDERRFPSMMKRLSEEGIASACALPLTTVHRRIGALVICSSIPDAYADEEVRFLSAVANQVALAVDDVLAQEELQQQNDRLQLLLNLTKRISSNLDLHELLRSISVSIREVLQSDTIGIALLDPDSGQFRMYARDTIRPEDDILKEGMVVPLDEGAAKRAVDSRKPVVVRRADLQELGSLSYQLAISQGLESFCFVPLVDKGRTLGLVGVGRVAPGSFSPADVEFLTQVAGQIAIAADNALAYRQISELKDKLAQEKVYLEDEIRSELNFEEIVGVSAALRDVLQQVETVAPTDSIVLITGETGTGKELIARAIHTHSRRKDRAFVKLNCAAIPTGLLESELFGHERGAFTGAIAQRIGRFELANRGTVFLDEIGEISLELQPKLLRVLQDQEFERLGSTRTLRSDSRLIAATNRDLRAMVDQQTFRADLFYRLNVFPVHLPALREREEDIPLLVRHFTAQFARRMNKTIETIPSETMERLVSYHWPGNVRELQNIIERAVILSTGPALRIALTDLKRNDSGEAPKKSDTLEEADRKHIIAALEETGWVVSGPKGAAARLGLHRATLEFRMKKLGIVKPGRR